MREEDRLAKICNSFVIIAVNADMHFASAKSRSCRAGSSSFATFRIVRIPHNFHFRESV